MLLVVVMSLFVGGTLVVLSGVLLLCKRCWEVHQRFNRCALSRCTAVGGVCACGSACARSRGLGTGYPGKGACVLSPCPPLPSLRRAMEEAEKTTTTYLDNGTHPAQGEAPGPARRPSRPPARPSATRLPPRAA